MATPHIFNQEILKHHEIKNIHKTYNGDEHRLHRTTLRCNDLRVPASLRVLPVLWMHVCRLRVFFPVCVRVCWRVYECSCARMCACKRKSILFSFTMTFFFEGQTFETFIHLKRLELVHKCKGRLLQVLIFAIERRHCENNTHDLLTL